MKTFVPVIGFVFLLFMTGCSSIPGLTGTSKVIDSQTPGAAIGSGGAVVGPANSAAPTTQVSERRTGYYPPQADFHGIAQYIHDQTQAKVTVQPPPNPMDVEAQPDAPSLPAWTYERTETTIGQHQDAAGLVKAAQVATGWSSVRWLGIFVTLFGIAGYLWSYNNPNGYPTVFLKVAIVGLIVTFVGSNPWLLLLLLIPLTFYLLQKFNLLKFPLP